MRKPELSRVDAHVVVIVDTREISRAIIAELAPVPPFSVPATAQHRLLMSRVARKSKFY